MNLGHYRPGDTLLHRLDPRVKISAVMALGLLVFTATPPGIAIISFAIAALLRMGRLSLGQALATLRPVLFFTAVIFLVHLVATEGEPLLSLAPLPLAVTHEGLSRGAFVTWQFAALVLGAAILTWTTSPSELVGGIERLLRPLARLGIPSQEIAMMIAMALRFLPMLLEEYDRLRAAQTARGADLSTGGVLLRMRAAALLAVPLLASAFRRADEMATAMEARGYRRGPRTMLRELRMNGRDGVALAVITAFALLNLGLGTVA